MRRARRPSLAIDQTILKRSLAGSRKIWIRLCTTGQYINPPTKQVQVNASTSSHMASIALDLSSSYGVAYWGMYLVKFKCCVALLMPSRSNSGFVVSAVFVISSSFSVTDLHLNEIKYTVRNFTVFMAVSLCKGTFIFPVIPRTRCSSRPSCVMPPLFYALC